MLFRSICDAWFSIRLDSFSPFCYCFPSVGHGGICESWVVLAFALHVFNVVDARKRLPVSPLLTHLNSRPSSGRWPHLTSFTALGTCYCEITKVVMYHLLYIIPQQDSPSPFPNWSQQAAVQSISILRLHKAISGL